ncbi:MULTISPECIES: hypothetical protein [Cellulophaga]|uniref:hypothetical protein n=1 Tax=Cellulophaga TaxID=104264 RepID=UPI0037C7B63C
MNKKTLFYLTTAIITLTLSNCVNSKIKSRDLPDPPNRDTIQAVIKDTVLLKN